ncbi:hypothetical protein HCBAA847_2239 [Helicobacter cinaedi CCUG 18818 = ATCC BAA-847]|uniref:Uncharacterized protein n=1 Tax=Helicobacter cinaedi CCUG 18818 = ATCC BAA-847 TaxID=537971 RepID=A0AAI8MQ86_9HELI|nr:hypothetical protein [Helicobacter cinaedi]EFR46093.1 hypothetical protein HCCG_00639 [Helicobacter cinaedi CCUG 18818 = ATCC BAA-847]BAM33454.1 hypothetical protein HCBAA847_2239 [Helicobacter cinaedi CCUG 18818 = ATCC BAA-847]
MDIMAKFLICVGNCFVNTINSVEKQLNLAGLSASRDEIKQFWKRIKMRLIMK